MDFDIGKVFAVGFVFEFKIPCGHVANFASVGCDVDF
jgi:hypothetical protein